MSADSSCHNGENGCNAIIAENESRNYIPFLMQKSIDIRATKWYNIHEVNSMEKLNVITAPKTSAFQLRINPQIRDELEVLYASQGLTLADAVNLFFQQSLNSGGIPFLVSDENAILLRQKAYRKLIREIEKGEASDLVNEADAYRQLGLE